MKLSVLGSDSEGNSYILESDNECLILDAGVSIKEVKIALDFNISKIRGVLVTHNHADHSKYVADYEKMGIPVFKPYEGMTSINLRNTKFRVQTFHLTDKNNEFVHTNADGTECKCYGYYIKHPELGILVYATDCTFIKWNFSNVNHLLLEANYDMDELDYDETAYLNHVFIGHQSIQTACDFISRHDGENLKNVVLCHLSSSHGKPTEFKDMASKATNANVYVAKKGMIAEL